MKKRHLLLICIVTLLACSDAPKPSRPSVKELQEALLNSNIRATKLENEQIEAYVLEQKIEMLSTGTGLRYYIYKEGEGAMLEEGSTALINYKVTLLDGTVCYETENKPESLIVGKSVAESGLHEAMMYLKEGDKAIVIIPSHLAHGLAGDLNKIPIRSTIIYDIELLKVN